MPRLNKSYTELQTIAAKKGVDTATFDALFAINENAAKTALNQHLKTVKVGRGRKSTKSDPVKLFVEQYQEGLQELLIRYREIEGSINVFNEEHGVTLILDMEAPNLVKVKGSRTRKSPATSSNGAAATKTVYDWAGFAAKLKANKASNKLVIKRDDQDITGTLQVNGGVKDADGTYENISAWTKAKTEGRAGNPYKITRIQHNGMLMTVESVYKELMK